MKVERGASHWLRPPGPVADGLRIGLLGGENTSSRLARYDAFQHLLQEKLAVTVKMYPAADYAGVMQAMASTWRTLRSVYISLL